MKYNNVKEALVAEGYTQGDIIENPDGKDYVVGMSKGKPPFFLMQLFGIPRKNKAKKLADAKRKLKAAKKNGTATQATPEAQGCITLTNGTFVVNGETICLSEDASYSPPAGATISSPI